MKQDTNISPFLRVKVTSTLHAHILTILSQREGPVPMATLRTLTGLRASSLSNSLHRMSAAGWLFIHREKEDRRQKFVVPSRKARRLFDTMG